MTDMMLSNRQIFWMMVSMQIIMTILLTTAPTFQIAQQDAWLSVVLATGIGCGIAYVCAKLGTMFPGKTLIEYSRILLGKWFGGFIAALYLMFWILIFSVILQQFTFFIIGTILPRTPIIVIVVLMVSIVLYPTLHGIGVIARCCEVVGPIVLVGVIGPILLAVNKMDAERLLPVYTDSGLIAIMRGSLPTATFLGDCIMTVMLISFVRHPKKVVRHAVWGVLLTGLFTLLSVFASLLMVGPNVTESYPYPLLMLVRSISIGGIIENMDAIVVAVWIMSIFTKLALYLFVASYGTSQLFHIKDWRKTVWVIAAIGGLIALIPINFVEASVIFPKKVAVPYTLPILMVGLPLFLLILAQVKRKMTNRKRS